MAVNVLRMLRTGTAAEHAQVERVLDLLDPELDRGRLTSVMGLLHGFWRAAEAGLDAWAADFPADARAVDWARRRRAPLFAADLAALGAPASAERPRLPALEGTDAALGRMYVLEGATMGGAFIDRHLAGQPGLADVRLRSFSPYGADTGAMWHAFRQVTRERMTDGGDADAVVTSAQDTFGALAAWCGVPTPGAAGSPSR
jgi:heme oxygenase (biliverdin-IX-beta and delta-forming)